MANSQAYSNFSGINEDFTRASGMTSINSGLPFGVIKLLQRHRRTPLIG
jgi:hypothetical protein